MAAAIAAAMGACVFEKHFTLSRDLPGPDHWFSETAENLAEWANSIRQAYTMLGSPVVRPTAVERDMRKIARRSLVARRGLAKGEILSADCITMRRPGTGLPAEMLDAVIGRTVARELKAGEFLKFGDFEQ